MGNLDTFKAFVKKNPKLINYVKNGEMTWQKFYEIFDLYGEDANAWKDYLTPQVAATTAALAAGGIGINDVFNWLKNVDLDSVQTGIGNIQRVVGVLQDFSTKDGNTTNQKEEYKPRPLYKHFED
jgi:hypothetical protein